MASVAIDDIPADANILEALRQQGKRPVQRISLVARWDIVAYNTETHLFQVWARKSGRNQVILNHELEFRDKQHFFDMVQLVGKVAQLPCTEELRAPEPWWTYRFA